MKKTNLSKFVITGFMFLFFTCVVLNIPGINILKTTNPNVDGFQLNKFKFNDYNSKEQLLKAINAICTSEPNLKEFEYALIRSGKAKLIDNALTQGDLTEILYEKRHVYFLENYKVIKAYFKISAVVDTNSKIKGCMASVHILPSFSKESQNLSREIPKYILTGHYKGEN